MCMCWSAAEICTKYFQMVFSGINLFCFLKCLIILERSPASASSNTIFSSLFSTNDAKYLITFGWLRDFRRSISLIQSLRAFKSIISKICTFFKATILLSIKHRARNTSENWPLPIRFWISKFPRQLYLLSSPFSVSMVFLLLELSSGVLRRTSPSLFSTSFIFLWSLSAWK